MCHAGKSLYSFFTYDTKGGVLSNIAFRLYRFREYKIILVQLFYIPFCIVIISRGFYFEFVVLKLMLFALPLLRNLYINYICWGGKPDLQVDFRTVLLSPLFNFFLIMCAVHGRLKCILWYIPNVPPNHGMLQRCKPRLFKSVRCDALDGDDVTVVSQRDASISVGTEGTAVRNPLSAPLIPSEHFQSEGPSIGRSRAEALLQSRSDTFELFERDGTSSIVVYHKALDDAHQIC
jgi:hypothetical protein